MPFSAKMSRVLMVSLNAGESQPRGALPTLLVMVETTSLMSARSSASDWPANRIEFVGAVAHPFPAEIFAFFDDARIARAHVGVQRDRAFDTVSLHHFHHPPDADAHAVVAPGIVDHVGIDRQVGQPGGRAVEQETLEIGDHPDGAGAPVRP